MGRIFPWPIFCVAAFLGCATPDGVSPQQRFAGWMKYRGEVMLFSTQEDYVDSITKRGWCNSDGQCQSRIRCISGVLAGKDRDLRSWDGTRVIVTGRLVNYKSLSEEDVPVLRRKMLANKVISNFCLRDQVILITSVRPA